MAETKYVARLKTLYNDNYAKELKEELKLDNINQVPKLEKVIVSSGVGKKRDDKRYTETVELTLAKITGQAVTSRLAKKSIAQFKIRKGMGAPVGYLTTLRVSSISCCHTSVTSTAYPANPSTLKETTVSASKTRPYFQKSASKILPFNTVSKSHLLSKMAQRKEVLNC